MALTGLEIFKHLPKTNCGECGSPTCLAFAMQLAAKKVSLDKCPYVSEEGKAALDAASAPPIRLVTIGVKNPFKAGNETVMFRHEESFYYPTGIAATVSDTSSDIEIADRVKKIKSLSYERIGQILKIDLIAVVNGSKNAEKFANATKKVVELADLPLVLVTSDPAAAAAALKVSKDDKPLLCGANPENLDKMTELAKANACSLAVQADNLDTLSELAHHSASKGVKDVVLNPTVESLGALIKGVTQIRRQALKKNFRPLGYPILINVAGDDTFKETIKAGAFVAKYGGIVVTNAIEKWQILPLLTLRQNIYTDPRKPIMVDAKLYKIGEPGKDAPVLVTTNFSLTYFLVAGEVEASKVPAYILSVDTEGLSVMTAWAAEKFTAELIAKSITTSGVAELVSHNKLVIPGYVAVMSGELEEETKREVLVGPREASGIPAYLKTVWKA